MALLDQAVINFIIISTLIYYGRAAYEVDSSNTSNQKTKTAHGRSDKEKETDPEFVEPIENITAPAGRTVKLACSVQNLGSYRVAWMHYEQSAILTVHTHVITRNPRISMSHDNHRTWFLHIRDVQEEDGGRYMCQINTVSAKTQFGYLNVVVPPSIDDAQSSSDVIVRENSNVTLTCQASGRPSPFIHWKREDGSPININRTMQVKEFQGNTLELARISRLDMGAYLCIASNGVPPAVSKMIKVAVDFPPMLTVPHQLVGAPLGGNVTLECFTEAHPTSLNYWTRENNEMIQENSKYHATTVAGGAAYKTNMRLFIRKVEQSDFGQYKCVAKNPRGETDSSIRLYMSTPPTTTTVAVITTVPPTVHDPGWDIKTDNSVNNSKDSSRDKLSKYQSNLNDVNKSEQKSAQEPGGKGPRVDWSPGPDADSGSVHHTVEAMLLTLGIQLLQHFVKHVCLV